MNPWKEEIALRGCELICNVWRDGDSFINPPNTHYEASKKNKIYFFLENIGRVLPLKYLDSESLNYRGLIGDNFYLDNSTMTNSMENDKYF